MRYRYEPGWRGEPLEELSRIWMGNLAGDPNGSLAEVPLTFFSDYSGSTVERSNYEVLLEDWKARLGISVWDVHGGMGTRGLVILVAALEDEDVKEVLEALEQYPVLDDGHLSKLELDLQDEAWDGWARDGLIRVLTESGYDVECVSDNDLWRKFIDAMDRGNIYWECEDAVSAWVDINRVVEYWEAE